MTRQELETEVGDGETVRKILEIIGFCPVSPVEKQRLYLRKDNMTACLDAVSYTHLFMNISSFRHVPFPPSSSV